MVMCIFTSFFDSSMNRADVFIGLQNYVELFHDSVFLGALRNTLIIVVVSVPITCIFSLWVASAIVNMPPWATSLFRVIFYLPVVTGSVAVTVVWKWMFNNYYGIFNYLGKSMGLIDQNINWLAIPLRAGLHHPDPAHDLCRPAHRAVCLRARQCGPVSGRGR